MARGSSRGGKAKKGGTNTHENEDNDDEIVMPPTNNTQQQEEEDYNQQVLDAIASHNNNQGVSDEDLKKILSFWKGCVRAEIINDLLDKEQITLHTEGGEGDNATCYFKRVSEEEMLKKRGLSSEDRLVLQVIETAGNSGMWTKEVKQKTNFPQVKVTKIFKTLEQRKLIKSVKHVAQQNRKVYMKYDLEPSREITGGAWFTDQEFDAVFVKIMRDQCRDFIRKEKRVTLQDVYEHIVKSKISNVNLRKEDVKQIVDTLFYDGDVEMITPEERRRQKMDAYENDFIDDRKNRRGGAEGMLMYESDEEEEYEEEEEGSEGEDEDTTTKKRKKGSANNNKRKNSNKKQKKATMENKKGSSINKKQQQKKKGRGGNESEEATVEVDDGDDFTETYYVPSKWKSNIRTPLSYVPCGICPVYQDCEPGGLISPEKCSYMDRWIRDIEEAGNNPGPYQGILGTEDNDDDEEE
ncbi:unnamed protein product [Bathycoccus prasinos]